MTPFIHADNPTVAREDMGRELRKLIFSTPPGEIGLQSDSDFPEVYGVVTDLPIGEQVATVVALRDGTASLYTTTAFGIIGGDSHEAVRKAAVHCAKTAAGWMKDSVATRDFRYPQPGEVLFYLLCYDGVRVIRAREEELYNETHPLAPLFAAVQRVLTELRQVSEKTQPKV